MGSAAPGRIASVRVDPSVSPDVGASRPVANATRRPEGATAECPAAERLAAERLAASLLAGSPRVALVAPGLGRADARGWERRGGEEALARALREAALAAGLAGVRVGIADVAVAADAASLVAGRASGTRTGASDPAILIVPPGGARAFLAPLPLSALPIAEELRDLLRALGVRRAGDLAALPREEVEARFGPGGVEAHRWARGEDDRVFRPLRPDEPPEASLELDGAVETLDPLLFVLRRLVERVCGELEARGSGAARLRLSLSLSGGGRREAMIVPARPTRRARLLFDLCRAALERAVEPRKVAPGEEESGSEGFLPSPVDGIALRVERPAPTGARQGDLFAAGWRDPMEASVTLARLRARLGEEAVAEPAPRADHRPEARNGWSPIRADGRGAGGAAPAWEARRDPELRPAEGVRVGGTGDPEPSPAEGPEIRPALSRFRALEASPSVLRLLPAPLPVRVRMENGCPAEVEDREGCRAIVAAEGPERLSGDWWRDPYRREYFRACTAAGELLWVFREYRPRSGELRWWLHGWWD